MKKLLMTGLLLYVTQLFKGSPFSPVRALESAKFQASLQYLRFVRTTRRLFLSLFGVGACLILLISGLIVLNAAIAYAPLSATVKMWIMLSCAAVYFLAAALIFRAVFYEEMWIKMFHASDIIKRMADCSSKSDSRTDF